MFFNEQCLFMPVDYPVIPTFFHTAGDFSSQIDYFFVSELLVAESRVAVHDMHHLNLSDHTHISIEIPARILSMQVVGKDDVPVHLKQRINWRKCDLQEYSHMVEEELLLVSTSVPDTGLEADLLLMEITSVLYNSSCSATNQRARRKKSKAGLPIWN